MIALLLLSLPLFACTSAFAQEANKPGGTAYDGQASDVWLARLNDTDDTIRLRAAYVLGQIVPPAPGTVAALIKAVDDRAQEVRWYAADSLGRLGAAAKQAIPTLLAGVKDPANDKPFARTAAQALGRIGVDAQDAVPWLVETLGDADPSLRVAAALALWRIKRHPDALTALTASLADPGEGSYLASMALLEVGPDARAAERALVGALGHQSADARRAAARVLGKLGPEMIPPLAKALGGTAKLDREAVVAALAYLIDESRETALSNPRASEAVFASAEKLCVETTLPAFISLFNDPSDDVCSAAARAAAKIGLPAARALMVSLIRGNERERAAATEALTRLEEYLPSGPAESSHLAKQQRDLASPLIAALRHREAAVRAPALRLFSALSWGEEAREAIPLLREALKSEDPLIRRNAARALEQVKVAKSTMDNG